MKQSIQMGVDVTFNVTDPKNQRLPIYKHQTPFSQSEDVVYLSDNDEFKIELKNYLKESVAAKIFINNKDLGNLIILRPGEHIYLERFLDDNKKFVYQTYNVDGDKQTIASTENNGEIKVEYYKEFPYTYYTNSISTSPTIYYTTSGTSITNTETNIIYNKSIDISESKGSFCEPNTMMYSCTADSLNTNSTADFQTGRIEKGNDSNQDFNYTSFNSNSYAFQTFKVRLMSKKNKPLFAGDIKTYCSKCKTRKRKDSHNFCPNCGQRYE